MSEWLTIRLWPHEDECAMCDAVGELRHAVGWYEGPVAQSPGERITLANGEVVEVGGMPVCRACHAGFYNLGR